MRDVTTWLRAEWDRIAAAVLIAVGSVLVVVGYIGAKGTPYAVEALSYIASGGIWGIFCLGLGVGLLVSGDLHDEWRKLDRIESAIRGRPLPDVEDLVDVTSHRFVPRATPEGSGDQGGEGVASKNRRQTIVTAATPAEPAGVGDRAGLGVVPFGWWQASLRIRMLGVVLAVASLGVMGTGWGIARGTAQFDTGVNGVAVASIGLVLGLALLAVNTLGLRTGVIRRATSMLGSFGESAPEDVPASSETERYWVAAGLGRYHRSGCAALKGLEAVPVERTDLPADQRPCGLCGS